MCTIELINTTTIGEKKMIKWWSDTDSKGEVVVMANILIVSLSCVFLVAGFGLGLLVGCLS